MGRSSSSETTSKTEPPIQLEDLGSAVIVRHAPSSLSGHEANDLRIGFDEQVQNSLDGLSEELVKEALEPVVPSHTDVCYCLYRRRANDQGDCDKTLGE